MADVDTEDATEEWHVIWNKQHLTKAAALEKIKSLRSRKDTQHYASHDAEQRIQAEASAAACESVTKQLSARKTELMADDPFDADEAFDKKLEELREEIEKQRSG